MEHWLAQAQHRAANDPHNALACATAASLRIELDGLVTQVQFSMIVYAGWKKVKRALLTSSDAFALAINLRPLHVSVMIMVRLLPLTLIDIPTFGHTFVTCVQRPLFLLQPSLLFCLLFLYPIYLLPTFLFFFPPFLLTN